MTCELQSTLEASAIEWPALGNNIPSMAHIMQLALSAIRSSLGVQGHTKSWQAHELNQPYGENEAGHWQGSKTTKWGQCSNQQAVGYETRFSKDNWESMYFKLFWKSWNGPSYSRECLLYWLRWHLVVENSLLDVNKPESPSWCYLVRMWSQAGSRHCCWLSEPPDYENSLTSGSRNQNPVSTSHSSQHRMRRPLSSTSWKFRGHSITGHCGYRKGIRSHCITLSQSPLTHSVI